MVHVIFYEGDRNIDCDVWKVFTDYPKSREWLSGRGWTYHDKGQFWSHPKYTGHAYIVDREIEVTE